MPNVADWDGGMSASCKPWFLAMDGLILYYWLMPISCHFEDCKVLLATSPTCERGAIAPLLLP